MDEVKMVGLGSLVLLAFISAVAAGVSYLKCSARWPDRPHEWRLLAGCMVEHQGVMVPEDRVWFERNN